MARRLAKRLAGVLLLGALIPMLDATATCEQSVAKVTEVAPGVYVRPGELEAETFQDANLANIGFIVGERCVAVIDSGGSPREGEQIRCAIEAVSSLPICYLIVTHYHFDHSYGSLPITAKPTGEQAPIVVGHERLARALEQSAAYYLPRLKSGAGIIMDKEAIVMPGRKVRVGETLDLDLGGRMLQVTAHEPAHTDNDLTVFDVKTGTLWLSDLLFVERVPTIDSSTGSLLGWLRRLVQLGRDSAARAVPGHGPVSVDWPAGAGDIQRYLSVIRDETRAVIAKDGTIDEAQRTVGRSEANRWHHFDEHHRRTVLKAFTELEWE